jgi:hypothetical protein
MSTDCAICPEVDYVSRLHVALRHAVAVAHFQSRHDGEWTRCKEGCRTALRHPGGAWCCDVVPGSVHADTEAVGGDLR